MSRPVIVVVVVGGAAATMRNGVFLSQQRRLLLQKNPFHRLLTKRGISNRVVSSHPSWIHNESSSSTSTSTSTTNGGSGSHDAGRQYTNLSPRSGNSLGEVIIPSRNDIDRAVDLASNAFETDWSRLSATERCDCLRAIASAMRDNTARLVETEALDTGIPVSQIRDGHIPAAIDTLEYYASLVSSGGLEGRIIDSPHAGGHRDSFSYTRREPLGVCAGIGAWNYPLSGMMWKVAPALACGNTMVFKPSECTPLSALTVAELTKDILPPSVLQVLTGAGSVAEQLIANPTVRKVSVTGSVPTGKKVAKQASDTVKRVTLELGGKSPLLVFDDSDFGSAIRVAAQGNFVNNGQVCSNCTRVYVQRTILEQFVDETMRLVADHTVVGDNMEEGITIGPVMMHPFDPSGQYNKITGMIQRAIDDPNVDLLHGGRYYERDGGFYVEPTIFLSHRDDTEIVTEEIFGPVMTILSFDTEEEVIQRANASPYGLAAGVMSRNASRAHRVAKKLEAGVVFVNNWNLSPVEVPFGPSKNSGYGDELGPEALWEYTQVKTVYMEMGGVDSMW